MNINFMGNKPTMVVFNPACWVERYWRDIWSGFLFLAAALPSWLDQPPNGWLAVCLARSLKLVRGSFFTFVAFAVVFLARVGRVGRVGWIGRMNRLGWRLCSFALGICVVTAYWCTPGPPLTTTRSQPLNRQPGLSTAKLKSCLYFALFFAFWMVSQVVQSNTCFYISFLSMRLFLSLRFSQFDAVLLLLICFVCFFLPRLVLVCFAWLCLAELNQVKRKTHNLRW